MTPSQQRIRFDRMTRRLEKKYIRIMRNILLSQLTTYATAIRRNTLDAIYGIDRFFPTVQLETAYNAMIQECFETFRIRDPEVLIKSIDTSVWVTLMQEYMNTTGGTRITQINRFSKAYVLAKLRPILNQGIQEGLPVQEIARNIVRDIEEYSGNLARYRADRIVRTEIIGSANRASMASVESAGIKDMVLKRWLPANQPERTRETHMQMFDHPAIPLDDFFDVPTLDGGTEKMAYPGDPNGSAANTISCRCVVIFERI